MPNRTPAQDQKQKILSALWIFVVLNYLYCDVMTHMDADAMRELLTGTVGSLHITQGFLLQASAFMEIPIAMVLLARLLRYPAARWANICAGTVMTAGQIASLFVGTRITPYYGFFSAIEIASTVAIVLFVWRRLPGESASLAS
jgi:hypothetical protein